MFWSVLLQSHFSSETNEAEHKKSESAVPKYQGGFQIFECRFYSYGFFLGLIHSDLVVQP
jgi:hypothetical protein